MASAQTTTRRVAALLADLLATGAEEGAEGLAVVVRGKAYHLLEQPGIQQRLSLPPLHGLPASFVESFGLPVRQAA